MANEWTREKAVEMLLRIIEEGTPPVKISAVKELNQMHGFNKPEFVDQSFFESLKF